MKTSLEDSALLTAILDAAADAIIVANAEGMIRRANAAAGNLFQYDPAELVGQSVNILMPAALADGHDGFMQHHMKTGENRIIGIGREVEGLRSDGREFPLHLSVGEAEVAGETLFVGILHDLTQRRATLDALSRSQRLDAIGRMTGGIAHDFNNLLTVVIGNLELLDMRNPSDQQRQLITDALEAAEMGADLTSRLLVFARKSNLSPVEADLTALCEETLLILRRTMGASVRIKTQYASDLNRVMVDPVQLQSALMNLALNARDAMKDGGELLISVSNVTIDDTYIAQETDIAPGHYVRLSVSDDGAGMSPEAQRRAFEPFFTTKSGSGGTGLGLAMVYGFVRQSGGHITLYSEEGHGTSFGLYFPAVDGSPQVPGETEQGALALSEIGAGRRVLVVEDNPKVRKLAVQRMRDLGFETYEAESGDIALAMLEKGLQVDLIFSDLVMPGRLNGYELAAEVNRLHPELKILLTSGYASDVVTGAMAHDRPFEILHKPYRIAELSRRLQTLFGFGA
ncbi:MAG: PAS domain S-box protein [Sulfitobacter sp.]|nr:PAS domain S-box protein [Sulfitobacter sp.]